MYAIKGSSVNVSDGSSVSIKPQFNFVIYYLQLDVVD